MKQDAGHAAALGDVHPHDVPGILQTFGACPRPCAARLSEARRPFNQEQLPGVFNENLESAEQLNRPIRSKQPLLILSIEAGVRQPTDQEEVSHRRGPIQGVRIGNGPPSWDRA